MEDTHVHALDYLSVVRRRRWWLITPIVVSVLVGLALVIFLPKEYGSSATLAVTAPMVSPSLVNQSAPFDNQERLRALSQLLLSPTILARVVREEQLGPSTAQDQEVARLRRSIQVSVPDPVTRVAEPRRLDTFIVTYTDRDPVQAQRVTNRLATVFVDESSKVRTESAENTSAFIAAQLSASQTRLAELEKRLRAAKEAHMGQLPEQMQANLQTLSGLRQQLESNTMALRSEQDRLSVIERQLDDLKAGTPAAGLVSGTQSAGPESRVLLLERDLAVARTTYTDKHPEVQRIQEELAAARRDATGASGPGAARLAQLQLDPAYRQLMADRETTLLRVREAQRASADARRQISVYQARVEAAPRVEQQLTSVQRDYDLEKEQYSALSAKLHASAISEDVQRNGSGEQFSVLYGATFPTEPTKPVPLRVMLISIVAGICLGAALTLGREYLDRSVHDVRQLKDEFDVPVLGEVARITEPVRIDPVHA
jgi:polysaccharide biosynthesis transport protein